MLYERLKAVFDCFKDKKDAKGNSLFNNAANQKSRPILVMIKSGLLPDPPGTHFIFVDSTRMEHLWLISLGCNCIGLFVVLVHWSLHLHQTMNKYFGHIYSGAWYSDSLLTLIRHQHNWQSSLRNDRYFPKLHHYDSTLIDKVNELYEFCFGRPKYTNWISTNDCLCTSSPFVICRIDF